MIEFIRETNEEYQAKSGEYLTSHLLRDFREGPAIYKKRIDRLLPPLDSRALRVGSAAHCYILEGRDEFLARYAVGAPINPRTQKPYGFDTAAYEEWEKEQGRPVISNEDLHMIENMAAAVRAHPQVQALTYVEDAMTERVVRREMRGVLCQCRPDWYSPTNGLIELKTCDSLHKFWSAIKWREYDVQVAFYRMLLLDGADMDDPEMCPRYIVAVEKVQPHRVAVIELDFGLVLWPRQQEILNALEELKECRETGVWPTRYEEVLLYEGQ